MQLSPEQERKRVAQWLKNGTIYDPRNDDDKNFDQAAALRNSEDYSDWDYGTEPLPGDHTWAMKKAPEGP